MLLHVFVHTQKNLCFCLKKYENVKQPSPVLAPVAQYLFSFKQNFFSAVRAWQDLKEVQPFGTGVQTQLYCSALKCYLLDKHYIEIAKEHTRPLQEQAFFFFFFATTYFFLCYLLKGGLSYQSNLGENETTKKAFMVVISRPSILFFGIFPFEHGLSFPQLCLASWFAMTLCLCG